MPDDPRAQPLVYLTVDQLRGIIRAECEFVLRAAVPSMLRNASKGMAITAKPNDEWWSIADVMSHYDIGRRAVELLIECGKLPVSHRAGRGGRQYAAIRPADAAAILEARPVTSRA